MLELAQGLELPPEQRLVLANDTTNLKEAHQNAAMFRKWGGKIIKIGVELLHSADVTLRQCSMVAADNDLIWIADPKLFGTDKSLPVAIGNYVGLDEHPPVGITVSTQSDLQALTKAQEIADDKNIVIFGVGKLSTSDNRESLLYDGRSSGESIEGNAKKAYDAGLKGYVGGGEDLAIFDMDGRFRQFCKLIVGCRSTGVKIDNDDQKRSTTFYAATLMGADLMEIGRQVMDAKNKELAFRKAANEIDQATI